MKTVRWLLGNIGQTLIILLISLLLLEVVFRCYNYFYPTFIFPDTSYNRFRGKPNAPEYDFVLNSRGFKDLEFKTQKAEGTYRILGLGDSFAFGVVPYRYNYLTLLEDTLNRGGKKAEVINMGIPSVGPKEYLALLVNEGLELKPDMVMVSFFVGNDFEEPSPRKLYSYSYFASFLYYVVISQTKLKGTFSHGRAKYDDTAASFKDEVFVELESARSEIYRKQNPNFERLLSEAVRDLARIKQICDQRHIALMVVMIPDNVQVDPALQAKVLLFRGSNGRPEDFDFALPNRLLSNKLNALNIEYFDLLDDFVAEGSRTVLYKPNDTHWNIAGNKLAAELIATRLLHSGP